MRIRIYMEKGGNPHLFRDDVVAALGELRSVPSTSAAWEVTDLEDGTIAASTVYAPDNLADIERELAAIIEENTGERVTVEVLADWP